MSRLTRPSLLLSFTLPPDLCVCLAFPACRSSLFYLGVREVEVELRLSLTPPFHHVIPDRLWPDSLWAADVELISDSPDTLSDSICLRTCAPGKPMHCRGVARTGNGFGDPYPIRERDATLEHMCPLLRKREKIALFLFFFFRCSISRSTVRRDQLGWAVTSEREARTQSRSGKKIYIYSHKFGPILFFLSSYGLNNKNSIVLKQWLQISTPISLPLIYLYSVFDVIFISTFLLFFSSLLLRYTLTSDLTDHSITSTLQ